MKSSTLSLRYYDYDYCDSKNICFLLIRYLDMNGVQFKDPFASSNFPSSADSQGQQSIFDTKLYHRLARILYNRRIIEWLVVPGESRSRDFYYLQYNPKTPTDSLVEYADSFEEALTHALDLINCLRMHITDVSFHKEKKEIIFYSNKDVAIRLAKIEFTSTSFDRERTKLSPFRNLHYSSSTDSIKKAINKLSNDGLDIDILHPLYEPMDSEIGRPFNITLNSICSILKQSLKELAIIPPSLSTIQEGLAYSLKVKSWNHLKSLEKCDSNYREMFFETTIDHDFNCVGDLRFYRSLSSGVSNFSCSKLLKDHGYLYFSKDDFGVVHFTTYNHNLDAIHHKDELHYYFHHLPKVELNAPTQTIKAVRDMLSSHEILQTSLESYLLIKSTPSERALEYNRRGPSAPGTSKIIGNYIFSISDQFDGTYLRVSPISPLFYQGAMISKLYKTALIEKNKSFYIATEYGERTVVKLQGFSKKQAEEVKREFIKIENHCFGW